MTVNNSRITQIIFELEPLDQGHLQKVAALTGLGVTDNGGSGDLCFVFGAAENTISAKNMKQPHNHAMPVDSAAMARVTGQTDGAFSLLVSLEGGVGSSEVTLSVLDERGRDVSHVSYDLHERSQRDSEALEGVFAAIVAQLGGINSNDDMFNIMVAIGENPEAAAFVQETQRASLDDILAPVVEADAVFLALLDDALNMALGPYEMLSAPERRARFDEFPLR